MKYVVQRSYDTDPGDIWVEPAKQGEEGLTWEEAVTVVVKHHIRAASWWAKLTERDYFGPHLPFETTKERG